MVMRTLAMQIALLLRPFRSTAPSRSEPPPRYVSYRPRLCKNADLGEIVGKLDYPKRSPRRFCKVGNGKPTPENAPTARFYTAWAKSSRFFSLETSADSSLSRGWSYLAGTFQHWSDVDGRCEMAHPLMYV
jgi:hypothetical protein